MLTACKWVFGSLLGLKLASIAPRALLLLFVISASLIGQTAINLGLWSTVPESVTEATAANNTPGNP